MKVQMFEGLKEALAGTDALIRAIRQADRERFTEAFSRSTIFFLQVPPGCEGGFDPFTPREEMLAHIRAGAQDISQRTQFTPFCSSQAGRKSALLFTRQNLVREFVPAYVRQIKRLMQFEVVGVKGNVVVRLLDGADSVVFNALTKHEAELPIEWLSELKTLSLTVEQTR
jgi:hypothetical protein